MFRTLVHEVAHPLTWPLWLAMAQVLDGLPKGKRETYQALADEAYERAHDGISIVLTRLVAR